MASLAPMTANDAQDQLDRPDHQRGSGVHTRLISLAQRLGVPGAHRWTGRSPRGGVVAKRGKIQGHIDGMGAPSMERERSRSRSRSPPSSHTSGQMAMSPPPSPRVSRRYRVPMGARGDDLMDSGSEEGEVRTPSPQHFSSSGFGSGMSSAFVFPPPQPSGTKADVMSDEDDDMGGSSSGGTKRGGGDFANAPDIDMEEGGKTSSDIIKSSFNYRATQAAAAEVEFRTALGRQMTPLQLASVRYYNMSNYAQGVLTGTEPGPFTAGGTIGQPRIIQPAAQLAQLDRNAVGLFCRHVKGASTLRDELLKAQYYLETTGDLSQQNIIARQFLKHLAAFKTEVLSSLGILRWWKDPNKHDAPLNIAYALCELVPRIACIAGQLQRAVRGQGGRFGARATVIADRLHAVLHEFTDFVNGVRATQGGVWSNFLARDNQPVALDSLQTSPSQFPVFLSDIVTYLRQYDAAEREAQLTSMAGPDDMMVRLALGNDDEQRQIRGAMAEGQASAARILRHRLAEARGEGSGAVAARAKEFARIAAENARPINRYTSVGRVEAQIQGGEVQVVLCVLGERDETTGRRQVRRAVQEQVCVPTLPLEAVGPVCTEAQRQAYFRDGAQTLADERSREVGRQRADEITEEAAAVAQAAKQGQLFRDYVAELQLRVGRLRTAQSFDALSLYPLIMAIFLGIPVPETIGSGSDAIQLGQMLHHIRESIMHVRRGNQAVSVTGEKAGTSARRARLIRAFIASTGSTSPGNFIASELTKAMGEKSEASKRLTKEFMIIATLVGGQLGLATSAERFAFAKQALGVLYENAKKVAPAQQKTTGATKRSSTPPPSRGRRGEGPGSGREVPVQRAMVATGQGFQPVSPHLRGEARSALQRALAASLQGEGGEGGGGGGGSSSGSSSMGRQGGHKGGYRRRTRRAGKRKKRTRRAGGIKRKKTRGGRRRRKGGRRRTHRG